MVTSPLAFLSGRYIADQLHGGHEQSVVFAFVASLTAFCLVTLAVATPFYLMMTGFGGSIRVAGLQNAFLIGVSWLLIPFLGVIRAQVAMLGAFAANAVLMLVVGSLLSDPSATALLIAFNIGFAITDAILLGALVRRFGVRLVPDPAMLKFLLHKWELPIAGLAYALGVWADKVVMWFGAPSGTLEFARAIRTMPSYDTAMFWAQLASIPVIAVAFVHVETEFSRLFRRFHARLGAQASLREITAIMQRLRTCVISNIAMLFVALAIMATMMTLLSFVFMTDLGLRPAYMSILRVAVWAMAFYTSAMFCFVFFLYFDLRRQALLIVATYAVLNPALTIVFLRQGQAFYGYGSMLAAAITFLLGFFMLLRELPWLHYHAFITNNTSL